MTYKECYPSCCAKNHISLNKLRQRWLKSLALEGMFLSSSQIDDPYRFTLSSVDYTAKWAGRHSEIEASRVYSRSSKRILERSMGMLFWGVVSAWERPGRWALSLLLILTSKEQRHCFVLDIRVAFLEKQSFQLK